MNKQTRSLFIHLRTEMELDKSKLLGIAVLFVFFGLTSVLTQMFMPQIMKLSKLEITNLPEPSIKSVLADYWGDIVTFSMILILFFMSSFSSELDINKSVYFYLARPISRETYYLTRFWLRVLAVIVLYFITSLLIYGYALFYFEPIPFSDILLSSILVSLALGASTALIIALSSWLSTSKAGIVGFIILVVQLLLSLIKPLEWISPTALASPWQDVLSGTFDASTYLMHVLALLGWIIVPCIAGLLYYRRRDLI